MNVTCEADVKTEHHLLAILRESQGWMSDMAIDRSPILSLLSREGRIFYDEKHNCMPPRLEWPVRCRRSSLDFNDGPRQKLASLHLRMYSIGVAGALDPVCRCSSDIANGIVEEVSRGFAGAFFNDGNANVGFHGIETLFPKSREQTFAGAVNSPSVWYRNGIVPVSGSYAGISTEFGYYGGAMKTGAWPSGECDFEADFFTPVRIQYSPERHEFAQQELKKAGVILVRKNSPVQFDGCVIELDDLPVGALAYGFDIETVSLHLPGSTLIQVDNISTECGDRVRAVGSILGNLKFASPRRVVKVLA